MCVCVCVFSLSLFLYISVLSLFLYISILSLAPSLPFSLSLFSLSLSLPLSLLSLSIYPSLYLCICCRRCCRRILSLRKNSKGLSKWAKGHMVSSSKPERRAGKCLELGQGMVFVLLTHRIRSAPITGCMPSR